MSPNAVASPWPSNDLSGGPVRERPTFDQVFSEHARYAGRTLRFLGVAEAELEDACQEVFIVVHRRLAELDPGGSVHGWVRQICVNVAHNQRRTQRRRREDVIHPPIDVAGPATQHDSAERNQLRGRLLTLLQSLDEPQRAVFVLYEIERMAMNEVAVAVGCPLQTAYSRLHAARARMEEAVRRMEGLP